MPQIVSCPTCGFRSQVPDHLVGQDVRCPKCKKIIAGNSSVSHSPQIMAGETYAHGTKPCPYCAMAVPLEAKKCRHCGETIDVTLSKAEAALRAAERAADLAGKHGPINVKTNVHAAGGAASSSSSAAASSSAVASRSGGFPLAWIFAAIGGAFVVFCILPCCGLQLLSVSKNPIPDSNRSPTPSQKLAKLQIKIDGSNNLQGVELFVDGNLQKSLNRQMTLQLPEGTHSLELKVNGEKRWSDSVKVNPSSQGDTM